MHVVAAVLGVALGPGPMGAGVVRGNEIDALGRRIEWGVRHLSFSALHDKIASSSVSIIA
jgi:hypothetical protein